MNKSTKYNIKNFYVGELYLSIPLDYSLAAIYLKSPRIEKSRINDLVFYGAINTHHRYLDIDEDVKREYEGVLTLFFKENDKYICLHDGKAYSLTGNNYCENMTPLANLPPKTSYNTPTTISIKEALILFEKLFKSKHSNLSCIYDKDFYNINDFYIGYLNLYYGFLPNNPNHKRLYKNIAERHLLLHSNVEWNSFFGKEDKNYDEYGNPIGDHCYQVFKCIFLKLQNNKMYNLNNFQIYQTGTLNQEHLSSVPIGESYYDWMVPLTTKFKESEINYNSEKITIPKALKLTKKLK